MANILKYKEFDINKTQIMDPPFDGSNLTNRVLYEDMTKKISYKKKKKIRFHCPGYLRIKIKNLTELNFKNLTATINIVIIFTINLIGIQQCLADELARKLALRFNRNQAIFLGQQSQQINLKKNDEGLYTFTVRKLIKCGMKANIILTPFQTIHLILSIKVQKVQLKNQDLLNLIATRKELINQKQLPKKQLKQQLIDLMTEQQQKITQKEIDQLRKQIETLEEYSAVSLYVNLMDFQGNRYSKISFSEKGAFGDYDLAELLLSVEYTNQELALRIRQQNNVQYIDNKEISPFQFAHFEIPLYKFPLVNLLTIFVPLWLLAILNLGVFFQDTVLADRLGSLIALMIAFVALIPVIRQTLPPNPNLTVVQALVYGEVLTTLFCLIESINHRGNDSYVFQWQKNGYFLASVVIGLIQVFVVLLLGAIHVFYWRHTYNLNVADVGNIQFKYKKWFNSKCDQHYRRKLDNMDILIYKLKKKIIQDQKKLAESKQQTKDLKKKKIKLQSLV